MTELNLQNSFNDRRSFLKLLAAAPLFATIGTRSLAAAVSSAAKAATGGSHSLTDNIYTRLGVRPFINARGTWTYLSGSLELPPVRKAAEEASHYFVDMYELQAAAGAHLAKLSGAEDGMVTSGSAGAMASAAAGCMAGTDPKKIYQLPDTTGMKNEIVVTRRPQRLRQRPPPHRRQADRRPYPRRSQVRHHLADRHGLHHLARRPPSGRAQDHQGRRRPAPAR